MYVLQNNFFKPINQSALGHFLSFKSMLDLWWMRFAIIPLRLVLSSDVHPSSSGMGTHPLVNSLDSQTLSALCV